MRLPKFIYLIPALILAGCTAQDDPDPSTKNDTVTFNVSLAPDAGSRSIDASRDGENPDVNSYYGDSYISKLYYQAFDVTDKNNITSVFKQVQVATDFTADNRTATISLQLPTSHSYDIVFWAQADFSSSDQTNELYSGKNPYTLNWVNNDSRATFQPTVSVDYTKIAENNTKTVSAFYASSGSINAATTSNLSITLRRAVAQVNVGTDLEGFNNLDKSIRPIYSDVTFSNLPNTLYVLTGATDASKSSVKFAASKNIASLYRSMLDDAKGDDAATKTVTDQKSRYMLSTNVKNANGNNQAAGTTDVDYAWVSMCYVLAPNTSYSIPSTTFTFYGQQDDDATSTSSASTPVTSRGSKSPNNFQYDVTVTNVPVTQNYRTNIISSLTGKVQAVVKTDFTWSGNQNNILRLCASQFRDLTKGKKNCTEIDYSSYDLIINLNDSTIVSPKKTDQNGVTYTNDEGVYIKARSIQLLNGGITGQVHLVSTGETYVKDVKFYNTNTAASACQTPLIVGDGTFGKTGSSDYSPTVRLEGLDFTGIKNSPMYDICLDGSIITPTSSAAISDGTKSVTVVGCTFAGYRYSGLYLAGLGTNAEVSITNSYFNDIPTTMWSGLSLNNSTSTALQYSLPNGIQVANTSGTTGVDIGISNCFFNYVTSGFPTTDYRFTAGLVGLEGQNEVISSSSSSTNDKVVNSSWAMDTWTISFKKIYYGTDTSNGKLIDLNEGLNNSLLGLPSGYKSTWFPSATTDNSGNVTNAHIYIDDATNEQIPTAIDFTAYPSGWFTDITK